jgi:hypothetical protein
MLENAVSDSAGSDSNGGANKDGQMTFGEGFAALKTASYPLLIILLCAPFIQPISLGPLATIGGLSIAAIGWQFARGRETPWLPKKLDQLEVPVKSWERLLKFSNSILGFFRLFTRTRLRSLTAGARGRALVGYTICLAGLLLAVPFVGIPFNNTFPAIMALCAAIAMIEDDGLMVVASFVWLLITLAYFALVIWAIVYLGTEAVLPFLSEHLGIG